MVKSLLFIKDGAEDREKHSEPDLVKKTDRLRITEILPKIRIFFISGTNSQRRCYFAPDCLVFHCGIGDEAQVSVWSLNPCCVTQLGIWGKFHILCLPAVLVGATD